MAAKASKRRSLGGAWISPHAVGDREKGKAAMGVRRHRSVTQRGWVGHGIERRGSRRGARRNGDIDRCHVQ